MSNPTLLQNYLFLAPLIMRRLEEELGAEVPVEGLESLAQARDAADLREAVVYVLWGGDRFDGGEAARAGGGSSQRLFQRWLVLIRIVNASAADKAARNNAAGALMSRVHKAMAGWGPEEALLRKFVRTQGPAPDYQITSGLYPLAFEINLAL